MRRPPPTHVDRVFNGSHIAGRLIHQINNMDLPLEPDTAYRLLHTPGLISMDSILPQGPQTIADLHQALIIQTFAPCPPLPDDDEDETAANLPEDTPSPGKTTLTLPAAPESKRRRRQAARQARRQLRQQKCLLNGKTASSHPSSFITDPSPFPPSKHKTRNSNPLFLTPDP